MPFSLHSTSPILHLSQLARLTFSHLVLFVIPCIAISLTSLSSYFPLLLSSYLSACTYSPSPVSSVTPMLPQLPIFLASPSPSPPFPFLNLAHQASNHPAKRALFLLHAVPHHGVQCVLNSPISLEAFYLPLQC